MAVQRIIILITMISLLIVSACLFDSNDDRQYEDRIEQKYKVITGEVEQLFDNGYMRSINTILCPYEYSEDGFYLVESPEMLDSVFSAVNYPGIDTLFPEDGMLLIYCDHIFFYEEIIEHTYSFKDDTVQVDLTIRKWLDGPYEPGIFNLVFPIGLTLK